MSVWLVEDDDRRLVVVAHDESAASEVFQEWFDDDIEPSVQYICEASEGQAGEV